MASNTPSGRQAQGLTQDPAHRPGTIPTTANGDEDDWVVIPPRGNNVARGAEDNNPAAGSSYNMYLDFQLRTRFGTLSFQARQMQAEGEDTPTQSTIGKAPHTSAQSEEDSMPHSQNQSLLFRLPVELRLQIYEHILRLPSPGSVATIVHRPTNVSPLTCLTILSTCRRALAEAEDIFYSINRLSLQYPGNFLASIGPRRRAAISKISLPVGQVATALPLLQELQVLPNLTSLHTERQLSIKYQDAKTWAIMAPQLIAEIRKMEKLVDLQISTPETAELNEHDVARKKKLDEIDGRLRAAVGTDTGT